jgi:hypothetical protein
MRPRRPLRREGWTSEGEELEYRTRIPCSTTRRRRGTMPDRSCGARLEELYKRSQTAVRSSTQRKSAGMMLMNIPRSGAAVTVGETEKATERRGARGVSPRWAGRCIGYVLRRQMGYAGSMRRLWWTYHHLRMLRGVSTRGESSLDARNIRSFRLKKPEQAIDRRSCGFADTSH